MPEHSHARHEDEERFVSGMGGTRAADARWRPGPPGVVEGHVNRIEIIKRQMYGRAGFGLLRKRVQLAS
ncbi:hypothetical protein ACWD8L_18885 [Streptomyces sp. NPDC005133]